MIPTPENRSLAQRRLPAPPAPLALPFSTVELAYDLFEAKGLRIGQGAAAGHLVEQVELDFYGIVLEKSAAH
jgi:hypothetical protein